MQYLISLYFDEKTDKIFRDYIKQVADDCGNTFMTDHQVPPHITVAAFESEDEESVITAAENCVKELESGMLQWVSIGALPSGVLYTAPVLNAYLQTVSEKIFEQIKNIENVKISRLYQPFQWFPHTTVAKKMTKEEIATGFASLQSAFTYREGKAARIGLATKQPYREIKEWKL